MTVLLAPLVAARGDAPAIVDERRTVGWRELDARVTRLVHALRERGLGQGDRIVTMLGNQAELVEVSLACALGGWVLVPLNWHLVAREVAYVLDDAEAGAVVVDTRWAVVVVEAGTLRSAVPAVCLLVGEMPPGSAPHASDDPSGFESYEAVLAGSHEADIDQATKGGPMFYTSGTTGSPKGVRSALTTVGGPPEMFTLMAHSMAPVLGLQPLRAGEPAEEPGQVQLVCGPMYHSAQWVFGMFALLCGATIVLQHRFDAAGLLALVEEHRITNLHLVPAQMVRMLDVPATERDARDLGSLRYVIHGAAPCSPAVKRAMIEWLGPVVAEYYGGTEGGFLASITAEEWLARPGSVGKPLGIVEVIVVGDDGAVLGPGETGEIWFRSLMGSDFEYNKAPDKTASAHREGGFGTLGDVGHLDADGYLFLSDRKIDMVVSGGVNIYPAEVEGVLSAHPAIGDVAVFGIPHDEMGEAVHAALVLRAGYGWSDDLQVDIDAHCRSELAGFKRPRSYEVLDQLPRTDAGKLTKRVLRDAWWSDRDRAI